MPGSRSRARASAALRARSRGSGCRSSRPRGIQTAACPSRPPLPSGRASANVSSVRSRPRPRRRARDGRERRRHRCADSPARGTSATTAWRISSSRPIALSWPAWTARDGSPARPGAAFIRCARRRPAAKSGSSTLPVSVNRSVLDTVPLARLARDVERERHDERSSRMPRKRDAHPVGPVVQLVRHLVDRLFEQERVEQPRELLVGRRA